MMKFEKTHMNGVSNIETDIRTDLRGRLVKTYQASDFIKNGAEVDFRESYYTFSRHNVIRGMHFQIPPNDHAKLVTVIDGVIIDVILDLRRSSPTFGQHMSVQLDGEEGKSVYIPRGCAHGFQVLGESAITFYLVTSEYSPSDDKGIRYDSFGYKWNVNNPIVSKRDLEFPNLADFQDYFV